MQIVALAAVKWMKVRRLQSTFAMNYELEIPLFLYSGLEIINKQINSILITIYQPRLSFAE